MKSFWKKYGKIIVPAVVVIGVLAAAFWFGGDAPGLKGWSAKQPQEQTDPLEEPAGTESDAAGQTDGTEQTDTPQSDAQQPAEGTTQTQPDQPDGMTIDPDTGKDAYQTDPVPSGKPTPVEPQDTTPTETQLHCTISVSCATILDNLSYLDADKTELVPSDGWILQATEVPFYEGESVFHVLQRTMKQQKIQMEFSSTPMYNSAYIEGIGNLYEFDCGEQSGWMYAVNDWFPNYGCSRYALKDGDVIRFVYTCDLGSDVGGDYAANRGE